MPMVEVQLNDDVFEVDAEALAAVERDARLPDGTPDWVQVCEWVELHGRLVKEVS